MKRNTKTARPNESGAEQSIETQTGHADFNEHVGAESHTPDSRRAGAWRSARTRIGKIARLPNEIREQLNRRLQDGEEGQTLLDWLNALPKTMKMLSAQFGGRPISKQNLSEWRQGGYRDWVRTEEDRLRVDRLSRQAAQLAVPDGESPLSERLAAVLLVQLAGVLEELQDASLPQAERWQLLRQMLREVAQARREDNRAARLRIEQNRWGWEIERLSDEREGRGFKTATQVLEFSNALKTGALSFDEPSGPVKPGQCEPGADGSDRSVQSDRAGKSAKRPKPRRTQSRRAKPSQVQSKPVEPTPVKEQKGVCPQDAGTLNPAPPAPPSAVEGNPDPGCGRAATG